MERRRVTDVFKSILIANRGEIAVRIIQACHEMDVQAVAVFSDEDAGAMHVCRADSAYRIGPAPSAQSYLDMDAILAAAHISGADAVHPGYGFLAENPIFAQRVIDTGLGWIGPSPDVIALMGDKAAAKRAAAAAGVPVIPGYDGDDRTVDRLKIEAERLGYPVMIKAVAGGGGRGMRLVDGVEGFDDGLEGAQREARAAFGDARVFLEKFVQRPRHVEIQIIGDTRGAVVHLGERDCSLQRRHQKVFEESPSPAVVPRLRNTMGEAAVRLGRECGYVGAGTVEFLLDGPSFYFLEMNTRIQVEHPVTEMVTGVDLVQTQIRVAAGLPLEFDQSAIDLRGHAIEARLYAEDPEEEFLPSTGELTVYRPPTAAGIRIDSGVSEGDSVSHYYDPMLAKLIAHAATREQALRRLDFALQHFEVLGVTTNLPFLRWCMARPEFSAGAIDTGFLDRTWSPDKTRTRTSVEVAIAAGLAATVAHRPEDADADSPTSARSPWVSLGSWSQTGIARRLEFSRERESIRVEIVPSGAANYAVSVDGRTFLVHLLAAPAGRLVFAYEGRTLEVRHEVRDSGIRIQSQGQEFILELGTSRHGDALSEGAVAGRSSMTAPMPSTLVKLAVSPGQTVEAQQILGVLEAMKMEHVLRAPHAAVVEALLFEEGDQVPAGSPIVRLQAK